MCQLCSLSAIADNQKWPKPLEPLVTELRPLIMTAHDEYGRFRKNTGVPNPEDDEMNASSENSHVDEPRPQLHSTVEAILLTLEFMDDSRKEWWLSPEKYRLRKSWSEEGEQKKLSTLHAINNKTEENISSMKVKVGMFCRYNLNMDAAKLLEKA